MKTYEIWDTETSNIIGAWDSESRALEVIRDAIRDHGDAAILDLALILESDDGESRLIAEGRELVALSRTSLKAASL